MLSYIPYSCTVYSCQLWAAHVFALTGAGFDVIVCLTVCLFGKFYFRMFVVFSVFQDVAHPQEVCQCICLV